MRHASQGSETPCWICGRWLDFSRLGMSADAHPYCLELETRAALGTTPLTLSEWAAQVRG